jgi:uncharacterized protein YbjT (DUF2867 family)
MSGDTRRTAILLGATGLVGSTCLQGLLSNPAYARVIVLGRRRLGGQHPKLEQHVFDFDQLAAHASLLEGDDLYVCLGTTRRKAGSKEAFRRVDFDYTVEAARLGAERGMAKLLLVSALGADARSSFFYNRVKGEAEEAVRSLPFREVHIFRPSLLLGERNDSRPMERAAIAVARGMGFLWSGPLRKYRPVTAEDVADAMIARALGEQPGVHVHENDALHRAA